MNFIDGDEANLMEPAGELRGSLVLQSRALKEKDFESFTRLQRKQLENHLVNLESENGDDEEINDMGSLADELKSDIGNIEEKIGNQYSNQR